MHMKVNNIEIIGNTSESVDMFESVHLRLLRRDNAVFFDK